MSANRVTKRKSASNRSSKKTIRNRSTEQSLLATTLLFGSEGMPYSACFNLSRPYVYSDSSSRCGEYISRKIAYDGNDVGRALSASLESRFDLADKEDRLTDAIISLQTE